MELYDKNDPSSGLRVNIKEYIDQINETCTSIELSLSDKKEIDELDIG